MDITESTLTSVASDLGVTKTIGQMSEIEKRLLRIIALQRQMKATNAMGDYAVTVESAANQLKVMENQVKELGTWIGNVFLKLIENILPYINGFIMALKEVIKLIAIFFGYKASTGASGDPLGVGDTTDNVNDLTSAIGGASKAVDEYNKRLMGFDVLNVISTPSDSGGGGGGVPAIDPAILSALGEYDSMMDTVRMKATDVKDRLMEWLGLTGSEEENLEKVSGWIENIKKTIKLMLPILIAIEGFKIFSTLSSTSSAATKSVEKMLNSIGKIGWIEELISSVKYGILDIVGSLLMMAEIDLTGFLALLGGIFIAISGIILVVTALARHWNELVDTIKKAWEQYGQPVIDQVRKAIEKVQEVINELYEQVIKPIVDYVIQKADELWQTTLQPLFSKISEVVLKVIELLLRLWNYVLEPLVKFLINTLAPIVVGVVKTIIDVAQTVFTFIGNIITHILQILGGLIDFVIGVFSGDWKRAWNGIKDVFKGIWNLIIDVAEGAINLVIDILNSGIRFILNGLKGLWNGIAGIIEDIGAVFGQTWNIRILSNVAQIPHVSFPRMYGDGGTPPIGEFFVAREAGPEFVGRIGSSNAVMNNDQIVSAVSSGVANAVARVMGSTGQDIKLYIDGREITNVVTNRQNRDISRVGV